VELRARKFHIAEDEHSLIASHQVVYISSVLFRCPSPQHDTGGRASVLMADEEERERVKPEDDFVCSSFAKGASSGQLAGSLG
jgi:hypothetical protein